MHNSSSDKPGCSNHDRNKEKKLAKFLIKCADALLGLM